jgi:hypothetical protein
VNIAALNSERTQRLTTIVERYNFTSLSEQLKNNSASIQARIGFVGEFSSGKSTLINAILGEALLPSRSAPTTANVIQIEADANMLETEYFVVGADGCSTKIDGSRFADLACGSSEGLLRMCLRPRGLLQPGMQLIDSPGINALVSGHAEVTLAQLSLLDGLVVCLHCEMGTVPANMLEFLAREEIQGIAHKLLFVLTAADQKSPASVLRVADSMENALRRVLPAMPSRPRIVVTQALSVLAGESGGITEFVAAFNALFVARIDLLREERRKAELEQCAGLVGTALRAFQKSLSYTDNDFQQALDDGQAQLDKLSEEKSDQKRRLEEWFQAFRAEMQRTANQFSSALARAEADQLEPVFAQLQLALEDVALAHVGRYAPGADIQSKPLPIALKTALMSSLQAHAKYVEHGVTAATMLAVTVATAGTGAGAIVAAEAGTAGAAQSASAAAAKGIARGAAKVALKKAGEVASESLFKQVFLQLATTMKAINPLEMAGSVVQHIWNGSEAKAALPQLGARLAEAYHDDLVRHLDSACFQPLEAQLLAVESGITEARKSRSASLDAFARQRDQVKNDLRIVDEIATHP